MNGVGAKKKGREKKSAARTRRANDSGGERGKAGARHDLPASAAWNRGMFRCFSGQGNIHAVTERRVLRLFAGPGAGSASLLAFELNFDLSGTPVTEHEVARVADRQGQEEDLQNQKNVTGLFMSDPLSHILKI